MKKYDVVVIGSGCGMMIVEHSATHGLKVALVDRGPLGGTCLNLGCIPSKMLIHPADVVVEIQEAQKLGVKAEVKEIDFRAIMERMRQPIVESGTRMREAFIAYDKLDFFEGQGHFVDNTTIEVNGEQITGDKIFIASGSRPLIPPIPGLDSIGYLTNETLLKLNDRPESIIIIGGGYIAVEYGHFFAAMGTKVTILEMADRLILSEEPEIAELLLKKLSRRMDVHTGVRAQEVKKGRDGSSVTVVVKNEAAGKTEEYTAQRLLLAVGRRSNADTLALDKTGIELDNRGFIKVNEFLETTQKNVFAVGDATGKAMFTHAANREALVVIENFLHNAGIKMDYSAVPHAVYSYPQIASVGLHEEEAKKDGKILVGTTHYHDVARGKAMMEDDGFAKIIVDKKRGKILGCHIIGPQAPELIQEVVNAMASNGHIKEINLGLHIHPALSELIQTAVNSLEEP